MKRVNKIKKLCIFLSLIVFIVKTNANNDIEWIKTFLEEYNSVKCFAIEYLYFAKSTTFDAEELNYIETLADKNKFNDFINTVKEKRGNPMPCPVDFVKFVDYKNDTDNKQLTIWDIHQDAVTEREIFVTSGSVYVYFPASHSWQISNNLRRNCDIYFCDPISLLTGYSYIGEWRNNHYECYVEYVTDLINNGNYNVNKQNNLMVVTIEKKLRDDKVILVVDPTNMELRELKYISKLNNRVEITTERSYLEYSNFQSIKFPKKIYVKNLKNSTITNEQIYIFGNIVINTPISNTFDIKKGDLVIDERINYIYKKGYPEIRGD